jgi:hypothetical protein
MNKKTKTILTFAVTLLLMTVASSVLWDSATTRLYDCTDECGFGFLTPGSWVHKFDGREIATVPKVVHGRPMSEPDTILQGWSLRKLWALWCLFAAATLGISTCVAWKPWEHKHS